MTLATQYQDALSTPTRVFKNSSDKAVASVSEYTPKIFKFDIALKTSEAAAQHRKFADFMTHRELDPTRARGMAAARASLADVLYPEDGTTLKTLRLKAGMTQTQLAIALDTSQPHIARLESGRQEPVISTCRKLAKLFCVSLDVLSSALERQSDLNERNSKQ